MAIASTDSGPQPPPDGFPSFALTTDSKGFPHLPHVKVPDLPGSSG
jgi:hypothetical protein